MIRRAVCDVKPRALNYTPEVEHPSNLWGVFHREVRGAIRSHPVLLYLIFLGGLHAAERCYRAGEWTIAWRGAAYTGGLAMSVIGAAVLGVDSSW
jgi:hypothetical protein